MYMHTLIHGIFMMLACTHTHACIHPCSCAHARMIIQVHKNSTTGGYIVKFDKVSCCSQICECVNTPIRGVMCYCVRAYVPVRAGVYVSIYKIRSKQNPLVSIHVGGCIHIHACACMHNEHSHGCVYRAAELVTNWLSFRSLELLSFVLQ